MPMKPNKGESQADFMKRCVPDMMGDGKRDNEQATAACLTMFSEGEKEKKKALTPEDDEEFADWMDRCQEGGEDSDECRVIWADTRSATKTKSNGNVVRKTHAEPVIEREFVMSDETPDRMNDIIMSTGWDLENFKKNPVALFNHNSNWPIGTWSNLRVVDGKLRGKLDLLPKGKIPRVDEIHALIEHGILKAVSVGFAPKQHEPIVKGDPFAGSRYLAQELVETSLVTVPANPNALAVAKSLSISDDTIKRVFAKPGSRDALEHDRRLTGKPADTSPMMGKSMSVFAQRITDSQARIVAYRDKLTEHLKNVDDSNVSDSDLETTNELNARIKQEEKGLASLKESEKSLLLSSDADNGNGNGNGHDKGNGSTITVAPSRSSRPFGLKPKTIEPIEYLVRDGVVRLFAHREKRNVDEMRKAIYGDDEATKAFIDFTTKAATAPAMTTTVGWAAELVQQVNADFLEPLYPNVVFPALSAAGLSLSFGRNGRISVPTRSLTPTIAGSFVGEGAPIPVRQGAFTAALLTPKKMAVITTWTREIDEHSVPAIEGLLRDAIKQDTAVSIDAVLLDTNPATTVRPAGLLNGVAGLTPTTGGGFNAVVGDLQKIAGALMTGTNGNIRKLVWLINPAQKLTLSLTSAPGTGAFPFKEEIGRNQLLTYPVIAAGTVPVGTVIAVDAADFVSVGGEAPRFEISDQATLHMEDTTPLAIGTPGTPAVVAAPVRSLYQTDSLALRLIMPLNWTLRRTGVVAWMAGVTW